ncbi:GIY-YIG nuclease family protein [Helicobacter ailurogastricus]|uniref:Excinuclease ABC subunit C n=1 Tax=Helicobacter ailurogastricus TaxID=1578720 RepID=A0A0K2XCF7_9HELI|nr:GIY-YIG nuclease family protein [Helicobacter ailurogastricus]CRF40611.1 Excinuclease ABC subunit C [Helicobacter ailurogastricus]CRF42265.1 Excinuclease ABC subunit C [Helicobacter ailurogastricus]CRF44217.1 Excinuclease ABC subunit C [Helicobacter ailurogastricus]
MDRKALENLPATSGVYLYFDSKDRLLYVGKAKNLQKRILSYFKIQDSQIAPNPKNSVRIQRMASQIAYLQVQTTNSEEEALLLENKLIKTKQPKYNILLKDSKTYPYICIDLSKPYPILERTRAPLEGHKCFGPFSLASLELLESVQAFIPLVQSKGCLRGKKPCIFHQMGRCFAPCAGKISTQDYAPLVQEALNLLNNKEKLCARLQERMRVLATQERFEEAAVFRDYLQAVQTLLKRTERPEVQIILALQELLELKNPPKRIEVFDVSHHAQSACVGGMVVWLGGKWVKNAYRRYTLQGKDEYSQMQEMLERRAKQGKFPDLWLIDGGRAQALLATQILESFGASVAVIALAKEKANKRAKRGGGDVADVIYNTSQTWHLEAQDVRLQFLQKLRDEAHRFALAYHRLKKRKAFLG